MVRFNSLLSPWMLIDQTLSVDKWPKQDIIQSQLIPISFIAKFKGIGVWTLESKVFTQCPEDCNLTYYIKIDGEVEPTENNPRFIQTTETDENLISISQFSLL